MGAIGPVGVGALTEAGAYHVGGGPPMMPAAKMAPGIALMLLAGLAAILLGRWQLGIALLCAGIAMAAVTVATRGPSRRGRRRRP